MIMKDKVLCLCCVLNLCNKNRENMAKRLREMYTITQRLPYLQLLDYVDAYTS